MAYDHRNLRNRQRASSLLRQLQRELIDVSDWVEPEREPSLALDMSHLRLSNVKGVHLYQSADGWKVDVAFRGLPPWMHPIVSHPLALATHEDAMAAAVAQLSLCAKRDLVPPRDPETGYCGFQFDGISVPVDFAMYQRFVRQAPEDGFNFDNTSRQLSRLRHIACGDEPMTVEAYEAASFDVRMKINFACCIGLAIGMPGFTRDDAVWDPELEAEAADDIIGPGLRH